MSGFEGQNSSIDFAMMEQFVRIQVPDPDCDVRWGSRQLHCGVSNCRRIAPRERAVQPLNVPVLPQTIRL